MEGTAETQINISECLFFSPGASARDPVFFIAQLGFNTLPLAALLTVA